MKIYTVTVSVPSMLPGVNMKLKGEFEAVDTKQARALAKEYYAEETGDSAVKVVYVKEGRMKK